MSDHAALTGTSIHAVALAALNEWRPVGQPQRTAPSAEGFTTSDKTGRIVVLRWQVREKAHVAIGGLGSEGLAARLRKTVERAIRAGALHLTSDTGRTTGVAPEFDDVVTWVARRVWARQGSLILRASRTEAASPIRVNHDSQGRPTAPEDQPAGPTAPLPARLTARPMATSRVS